MLIDGFRRLNRKRKRIIWVLESRRDHILSGVDIQNIRVPHNRMSSITRQKLWSDVHTHTPRNIKTHAYQSFFLFFFFLHAYQYAPYSSKSGAAQGKPFCTKKCKRWPAQRMVPKKRNRPVSTLDSGETTARRKLNPWGLVKLCKLKWLVLGLDWTGYRIFLGSIEANFCNRINPNEFK